jgi:hypothetical protein
MRRIADPVTGASLLIPVAPKTINGIDLFSKGY